MDEEDDIRHRFDIYDDPFFEEPLTCRDCDRCDFHPDNTFGWCREWGDWVELDMEQCGGES